jgi:hypothetical protein
LSLCNRSHPLSSSEQRAPWGKIHQSTSNGGNERRDGNTLAMAMDGATTMRWRCNGDNNETAMTGGSSLVVAQRRRWWLRNRMTAVTAEAWRWQVGGGVEVTAVVVAALAAWRHQRRQLNNNDVFLEDNLYASGTGPFVRRCPYTHHPPAYPTGPRLCCTTGTRAC